MKNIIMTIGVALGLISIWQGISLAEEDVFRLAIKEHRFVPEELIVPAGKRIKVIVENQDATAEEFESYQLNREKVVSGGGKITLFLGPLKRGNYKYFGELHKDTANGVIRAEA